MKLFEFLLTSHDQTAAVVVGAPTMERAEKLIKEEYFITESDDPESDDGLYIWDSKEIEMASANEEFVREVFNTNML